MLDIMRSVTIWTCNDGNNGKRNHPMPQSGRVRMNEICLVVVSSRRANAREKVGRDYGTGVLTSRKAREDTLIAVVGRGTLRTVV